jgi:hypothetical protein
METDGLRWTLALAMVAVAVFHTGRLAVSASRRLPSEAAVDVIQAVMGTAMTVMLVGRLDEQSARAAAVGFGAALGWFVARGVREVRAGRRAHVRHAAGHAVLLVAMVFMLATAWGVPAVTSMDGMVMDGMVMDGHPMTHGGERGFGVSALVALVLIVGAAAAGLTAPYGRVPAVAPTATASCQVVMSIATVYMLAAML